jgi:hypothetical protein
MRKTNIIILIAFTLMVILTISDGLSTSYYALGGLIILGACGIIYSLWRVQRMSGVSWKESGERARELLQQAEDGYLPEDYEQTRLVYYPEGYEDEDWVDMSEV